MLVIMEPSSGDLTQALIQIFLIVVIPLVFMGDSEFPLISKKEKMVSGSDLVLRFFLQYTN